MVVGALHLLTRNKVWAPGTYSLIRIYTWAIALPVKYAEIDTAPSHVRTRRLVRETAPLVVAARPRPLVNLNADNLNSISVAQPRPIYSGLPRQV